MHAHLKLSQSTGMTVCNQVLANKNNNKMEYESELLSDVLFVCLKLSKVPSC